MKTLQRQRNVLCLSESGSQRMFRPQTNVDEAETIMVPLLKPCLTHPASRMYLAPAAAYEKAATHARPISL
jgi:hypothetical protein